MSSTGTFASVHKIDSALGQYYHTCGKYDYFDNNGLGKFLLFCQAKGFSDENIEDELEDGNELDCEFIEFDLQGFPLLHDVKDETERKSKIFKIIQHCYKTGASPLSNAHGDTMNEEIINPLLAKSIRLGRHKRFVRDVSEWEKVDEERKSNDLVNINNTNTNNQPNQPQTDIDHEDNKQEAEEEEQDESPMFENDLQRMCYGLGLYYQQMGRQDYYDSDGKGKFSKWFEAEEMEIDDMKEELIDGNIENCSYIGFDSDPRGFPLYMDSGITDESEKQQKQFEILVYIYKHSRPPPISMQRGMSNEEQSTSKSIHPSMINFDIDEQAEERANHVFSSQCPRLHERIKDVDLSKLLSISYANHNIPFALWMTDCFMRDRLVEYIESDCQRLITVAEWTTGHNKKISDYIDSLTQKQTESQSGKHDIRTCIQQGIKSYIHRILPRFRFERLSFIRDDLSQIVHYFEAGTQFLLKIIGDEDGNYPPFQVMLQPVVCVYE